MRAPKRRRWWWIQGTPRERVLVRQRKQRAPPHWAHSKRNASEPPPRPAIASYMYTPAPTIFVRTRLPPPLPYTTKVSTEKRGTKKTNGAYRHRSIHALYVALIDENFSCPCAK